MRLSRHHAWRAALVLCLGMIVMDNKMTLLRRHRLWLTLGWAWIALVVYLSHSPRPPEIHMPSGDKIGHIAAYTFLMLWFVQLYQSRSVKFAIALGLGGLGIAIEFAQEQTGYRTFEVADMWADAMGVALGLLLGRTPLATVLRRVEQRILAS